MGEKPSLLGEDFSRPSGPETEHSRSARRPGCCSINVVRDKRFSSGGGESRIHSTERKAAEATAFRRLEPSLSASWPVFGISRDQSPVPSRRRVPDEDKIEKVFSVKSRDMCQNWHRL